MQGTRTTKLRLTSTALRKLLIDAGIAPKNTTKGIYLSIQQNKDEQPVIFVNQIIHVEFDEEIN